MHSDSDIQVFLSHSRDFMHINALSKGWEGDFVRGMTNLKNEQAKLSFRRGFAKSILGQLTPNEYEDATGWDFDTDEEFRAHLLHYWQRFYGPDDPTQSV